MSEILIFAEIEEGDLHSTAGELIAAGRKISDDTGDSVSVAIIGGNQDLGSKAIALGADKAYIANDNAISEGVADSYLAALHKICLEVEPNVVCLLYTSDAADE